ncbi:HAD family hydrolase [Alkalispirochaeta odontotermitis]|nr:HAD family hydrolase [Alkalispirochaeta odontotermitis]CAB1075144.1 Haloacid dehalogenase-like hydrolase [Olavius algarvensis Delta 1 endosymbiont]
MKPFEYFPSELSNQIRYILTDIDDTLTVNGRLPSVVFVAMEQLQAAKIRCIPITGRPAGWCDHIARMWPVDGLVGENGAFYFRYDDATRKMLRRYFKPEIERQADRRKLADLKRDILKKVPGAGISADQPYREADLAIDYCEDIPPLPPDVVDQIVNLFEQAGAAAKVSSIHVNGWFGEYDKLTMTQFLFEEVFGENLEDVKGDVIYTGDSPNDAPMFAYFPHSVGVANVKQFEGRMLCNPAWITRKEGGYGFAEMVDKLLAP